MVRDCDAFRFSVGDRGWTVWLRHQVAALWWICLLVSSVNGFTVQARSHCTFLLLPAVSDSYLEGDLIAVQTSKETLPRLCVVQTYGSVVPLCQKEDDVETDLFADPRVFDRFQDVNDSHIVQSYGESWYGQRPVPSLGGGPGYGAEADDVWSVSEAVLERVRDDGIELPVLDVGISHGEKARGGFY